VSERDILTQWLGHAARRLRFNSSLREATALACGLLLTAALYQALRVTPVVPEVLTALLPLLVLAALVSIALFAWRFSRRPTLAQAAAAADRRADLKDQLGSALWFAERHARSPMILMLLEHAELTVQRLELKRVFPLVVPRGLPVAAGLALLAGVLACLSPRAATPLSQTAADVAGSTVKTPKSRSQQDEAEAADRASKREQAAANAQLDQLMRELATDASPEAIAQALGARDPKSVAQLMEAIRRRQAAAQASGTRATRKALDQMTEAVAQGILERLKELTTEEGGVPQTPPPLENAEPSTEQLQRELRAEMDEVQRSRPGEQSTRENDLNTQMRGMSRRSTGGRELVRGESDPLQEAGRTSVGGGGSMGRRIGVSQAGGGDGEQPRSNPEGNAEAEEVMGKKTQRLAVQLQAVKVEQSAEEDPNGAEEAFYAATQAQASKLEYATVVGRERYATEQGTQRERMPMAYRDAVKQYMVGQHGKEKEKMTSDK